MNRLATFNLDSAAMYAYLRTAGCAGGLHTACRHRYLKMNATLVDLKTEAMKDRHWKDLLRQLRIDVSWLQNLAAEPIQLQQFLDAFCVIFIIRTYNLIYAFSI